MIIFKNCFLAERFGALGGKLQRRRGRTSFYNEEIAVEQRRIRRQRGASGSWRDKVADRTEGGAREEATEAGSSPATSPGEW